MGLVSRSLRHPFKGSNYYLRPPKERPARQKPPRQPRMHQSRFSVEGIMDAPDTTDARPGPPPAYHRSLVVIVLFAVLGLRLWALQVLQAPAAAHAVAVNQIRAVAVEPTRGEILDRYDNPLVTNQVIEQITLSRVAATQYPAVIGRLAALIGETTPRSRPPSTIANSACTSRCRSVDAPLTDILYIKEHQSEFPGVSSVATTERNYPQLEMAGPGGRRGTRRAQALGYVGTINSSRAGLAVISGVPGRRRLRPSGLEYQYESAAAGHPGQQQLEVNPEGQVVGIAQDHAGHAGDNLVTNIDTNLQQVADNALATQILTSARPSTPSATTTRAARHATGGAVVVMSPRPARSMPCRPTPLQPNIMGGGDLQRRVRVPVKPGQQRAPDQPGHRRPVHPGFHLQAQHGHRRPRRVSSRRPPPMTTRAVFMAPNCSTTAPTAPSRTRRATGPSARSTSPPPSPCPSDDFFYNLGAEFYDDRSNPVR
jgi:hypothetical protein